MKNAAYFVSPDSLAVVVYRASGWRNMTRVGVDSLQCASSVVLIKWENDHKRNDAK